ncbi:nuclease-related domain-containing protein [Bacillus sp. DJP31]|uniref:nuclease-related domain-containing protein n=1 Tax=Bacillus sp. DJP31 TaxID=3409789 RepID=UPI003BB50087
MIIKPRYQTLELKTMRSLKTRKELSVKEETYYLNLEKGYQGEQMFDLWINELSDDYLILHDLLFESNHTVFQIDTLLISKETIYLFEVKNFDKDYYTEDNKWYTINKTEIKNPLLQLIRNESLFRRLLQDIGYNSTVESTLIFINPNFFLYQAPLNIPAIFSTQLERFQKKLNSKPSKLNDRHIRFAEKLLSISLEESPYSRLPSYSYEQLTKGITCRFCHSFVSDFNERRVKCHECECEEELQTAIIRCVEEYITLFSTRRITTNSIHEWCKGIVCKKTIQRVLGRKYKLLKHGRSSYYVNNTD